MREISGRWSASLGLHTGQGAPAPHSGVGSLAGAAPWSVVMVLAHPSRCDRSADIAARISSSSQSETPPRGPKKKDDGAKPPRQCHRDQPSDPLQCLPAKLGYLAINPAPLRQRPAEPGIVIRR